VEAQRDTEDVRRRLVDLGASGEDVDRALENGWLPLLALDRMLVPGLAIYDADGVAAAAGLDPEFARRLWRALGFPDVPPGIPLFSERAVEAARLAVAQASERELEQGTLLQQVRVISASLSRIAAVEAEVFADAVQEQRTSGMSEAEIALSVLSDTRFANISVLIDYVHRLQLRAAVWRRLAYDAVPDFVVAVGFADLSGYTELSSALAAAELSDLVGRWEALAYDTLTAHGARVVKTIGDEVMFVGVPVQVVASAVALRDAVGEEQLPAVRIGVAEGPVVRRDGDFYGPTVNLASRLTEVADRGEILLPAEVRDEFDDPAAAGLRFVARGRRFLRSIGDVTLFAVEAARETGADSD
jgi:adenylate cyclase